VSEQEHQVTFTELIASIVEAFSDDPIPKIKKIASWKLVCDDNFLFALILNGFDEIAM